MSTDLPRGGATPSRRGGAPEAIGAILARAVPEVRRSVRRQRSEIADAWADAAGPELAAETRPASIQKGVLVVEVRSPALLAELQGFRRDALLARVLAVDPTHRVTGLRFRPGVF